MALTLEPNAVTSTSISPTVGGLEANGTHEYQLSARSDFDWCVAPILAGPRVTNPSFTGLNSDSLYYVRARAVLSDQTIGDWSNVIAVRTSSGAARDLTPAAIMIEPAMLVAPEPFLSISALGEDSGFPAKNMAHDGPTMFFTRRDAATQEITVEVGDVDIDTVAILGTNLSASATVTIRGGSTSATSDYNSGALPFRASPNLPQRRGFHGLFRLPAVQRHRFYRINITDDRQPRGIAIQHLVMGLNRVSKNYAVEKVETAVDLSSFTRNVMGNPVRARRARLRQVDFDISVMKEADFETKYGDLYHLVGTSDPVLCVPNTKAGSFLHDRILLGPITAGRSVNVASPYFTRTFQIESII